MNEVFDNKAIPYHTRIYWYVRHVLCNVDEKLLLSAIKNLSTEQLMDLRHALETTTPDYSAVGHLIVSVLRDEAYAAAHDNVLQ